MAPFAVRRLCERLVDEIPGCTLARVRLIRPAQGFDADAVPGASPLPQASAIWRMLATVADALLRFSHALPRRRKSDDEESIVSIETFCARENISLDAGCVDGKDAAALPAVDLCVVYAVHVSNPALGIPLDSDAIAVFPRDVTRYSGVAPVGYWELKDVSPKVGITVCRVDSAGTCQSIVRATHLPIDRYDDLRSLAIKARQRAEEELLAAIQEFASGKCQALPLAASANARPTPGPAEVKTLQRSLRTTREQYVSFRIQPRWQAIMGAVVLWPFIVIRNWRRRWRGQFPIAVLFHHLVEDNGHPLAMPTSNFDRQMRYLRRHYRLASLAEAKEMLDSGRVEAPTVVLTFDDGYAGCMDSLRAIAEHHQIPYSVFVCPDITGQQLEFPHDLDVGVTGYFPLTWDQVRRLADSGVEIGSHTFTHFDCSTPDVALLEREIKDCRTAMEEELGRPVPMFAFPYGHHCEPARAIAKETYAVSLTTSGQLNFPTPEREGWRMERIFHLHDLFELELALQSILEFPALSRWLRRIRMWASPWARSSNLGTDAQSGIAVAADEVQAHG